LQDRRRNLNGLTGILSDRNPLATDPLIDALLWGQRRAHAGKNNAR